VRGGLVRGSFRVLRDWPSGALVEAGKLDLGASRQTRGIEVDL